MFVCWCITCIAINPILHHIFQNLILTLFFRNFDCIFTFFLKLNDLSLGLKMYWNQNYQQTKDMFFEHYMIIYLQNLLRMKSSKIYCTTFEIWIAHRECKGFEAVLNQLYKKNIFMIKIITHLYDTLCFTVSIICLNSLLWFSESFWCSNSSVIVEVTIKLHCLKQVLYFKKKGIRNFESCWSIRMELNAIRSNRSHWSFTQCDFHDLEFIFKNGNTDWRPGKGRRRATMPNDWYLTPTSQRHQNMNTTLFLTITSFC